MKRITFLALVALLLLAHEATAQVQPQYGFRAGGNLAQLSGKDNVFGKNTTDYKLGYTVGAFAEFPLSNTLALRPEVLYTQKGGRIDASFIDDAEVGDDFTSTFTLNYLKVPVLAKYNVSTSARLRPSLYAGPYVAYSVKRSIAFNLGEGIEEEIDFAFDAKDFFKTLDYGAVFGVDFGYHLARRPATIGARYTLGMANVLKDAVLAEETDPVSQGKPEARARDFAIVLGVTLF